MLKRLLSRGVELDLGNGATRFRSHRDLQRALDGKIAVSPLAIAALGRLSQDALRRAEDDLSSMQERISRALSPPPGDGGDVDGFLRELDLALVSEDHDWRSALGAAKRLGPDRVEYQRAMLRGYAAYLSSGRQLLRAMRSHPGSAGGEAREPPARPEHRDGLGPRQSLIFDPADLLAEPPDAGGAEEFNRLSKGEPLALDLGPHQSLTVLLGRYRFLIVGGEPGLLVDDNGNDYRLRPGRNIVGRSARCDVAIDPVYRSVSRKHAIVEAEAGTVIRLTDISTLGTFVPREYLDNRLH